jgi:hypothetical protein
MGQRYLIGHDTPEKDLHTSLLAPGQWRSRNARTVRLKYCTVHDGMHEQSKALGCALALLYEVMAGPCGI